MKIIFGLGNPGPRYAATRHNCGFLTLDQIARELNCTDERNILDNQVLSARFRNEKLLLAKPQSFMNLSGFPLEKLCAYYKVSYDQILVIQDDMDLPLGALRLRRGGSDGGHNGIKSIIAQTGTTAINRLKLGIGHAQYNVIDHVISPFAPEEWSQMEPVIRQAAEAALCWVESGIGEAMNRFNRVPLPKKTEEVGLDSQKSSPAEPQS